MKVKTLAILLIVLAVLTGLVFVVFMQRAPREGKREMGARLLKHLAVNDIASVTILDGEGQEVRLARMGDRWVVKNRFGYPADFRKIEAFVRKLRDAKIGRSFPVSQEVLKRLHLKDPADKTAPQEEKGTRITFADAKGKVLVRLMVGTAMKGGQGGIFPQGQYVLLGNGKTVYLIDKQFEALAKTPSEWLKKDLIDVKAADVQEIVCLGPDGKTTRFAFKRPAKGKDLEPLHLPAGKKIDKTSVNRLADALSALRIEDVVGPAGTKATKLSHSPRIEFRLFDGMIYDLYPGKKCKEASTCYLKVAVRYEHPAPLKKASGNVSRKNEHKKKAVGSGKSMEQKAATLNKELGRWVYTIPQWKHDAMVTDLASLLKKEKKK